MLPVSFLLSIACWTNHIALHQSFVLVPLGLQWYGVRSPAVAEHPGLTSECAGGDRHT